MATPRKSRLDELADKVTVDARPSAGSPVLESDEEAKAAERDAAIERCMRERGVPNAIACIIVDKGYSKGTAYRIWNDQQKRLNAEREARELASTARSA